MFLRTKIRQKFRKSFQLKGEKITQNSGKKALLRGKCSIRVRMESKMQTSNDIPLSILCLYFVVQTSLKKRRLQKQKQCVELEIQRQKWRQKQENLNRLSDYVSDGTALKNVVEFHGLAVNGKALFGGDFLFGRHTHTGILAAHSFRNSKQELKFEAFTGSSENQEGFITIDISKRGSRADKVSRSCTIWRGGVRESLQKAERSWRSNWLSTF